MNAIRSVGAVLAAFASQAATCAEIETLSVSTSGTAFTANVEFVVVAPYETVLDAFTDYERLAGLNPAVVSSSGENLPDGKIRVRSRVRDCVALFCRSVTVVEDVWVEGDDLVFAKLVPELSDFKSGQSQWRFQDLGDRTRIHYSSRMTPDFWMPPFVGSRALSRTIRRQIEATSSRIEVH